ncbi:hypothetical protein CDAR_533561 [Caerostris darwini]|uniref:Uncharacterized protein n=1 Tax=Caerostris darwini TaxID=1538125 RepID=A0AAV4S7S9_9ARAC|nr:hypothetical protein CDAR_533561 [Caerostris darwini]
MGPDAVSKCGAKLRIRKKKSHITDPSANHPHLLVQSKDAEKGERDGGPPFPQPIRCPYREINPLWPQGPGRILLWQLLHSPNDLTKGRPVIACHLGWDGFLRSISRQRQNANDSSSKVEEKKMRKSRVLSPSPPPPTRPCHQKKTVSGETGVGGSAGQPDKGWLRGCVPGECQSITRCHAKLWHGSYCQVTASHTAPKQWFGPGRRSALH